MQLTKCEAHNSHIAEKYLTACFVDMHSLIPIESTNPCQLINLFVFSTYHAPTNSVAPQLTM